MKKFYSLTIALLLSASLMEVNAQDNLIKGGSMEAADESSWSVSNLANDPTSVTEYTFGYTDDAPTGGSGGCLHFATTNVGTNGSHIMFYQQVTLTKGTTYQFDFAAKAIQTMNNSWLEVYLGSNEPVEGSDYGTGQISLGGFKWSGWESGCSGLDLFDGTLREIGCMANSQSDILIEGEGDTTMYIGFKAGIWATACTVEFVVDSVTLVAAGSTSAPSLSEKELTLFPNPVKNTLEIVGGNQFAQIKVTNIAGQEVIKARAFSNTLDVSSLRPGIYFVECKDIDDHAIVKKFTKL